MSAIDKLTTGILITILPPIFSLLLWKPEILEFMTVVFLICSFLYIWFFYGFLLVWEAIKELKKERGKRMGAEEV